LVKIVFHKTIGSLTYTLVFYMLFCANFRCFIQIELCKLWLIFIKEKYSPMSFDQWSHENNPIKMLHEILKCLLTSGLMKIIP
jgi:hypothetical protein